jgi:formate hydrogenlyase subunit 3/multisubunit Na+/H+ antiporter MnhD subunit
VAVLLWQRRPSGVFLAGAGLVFWVIEAIGVAIDQRFGHRADPGSDVAALASVVLFVVLAGAALVPLVLWLRVVPARTREGGQS